MILKGAEVVSWLVRGHSRLNTVGEVEKLGVVLDGE